MDALSLRHSCCSPTDSKSSCSCCTSFAKSCDETESERTRHGAGNFVRAHTARLQQWCRSRSATSERRDFSICPVKRAQNALQPAAATKCHGSLVRGLRGTQGQMTWGPRCPLRSVGWRAVSDHYDVQLRSAVPTRCMSPNRRARWLQQKHPLRGCGNTNRRFERRAGHRREHLRRLRCEPRVLQRRLHQPRQRSSQLRNVRHRVQRDTNLHCERVRTTTLHHNVRRWRALLWRHLLRRRPTLLRS